MNHASQGTPSQQRAGLKRTKRSQLLKEVVRIGAAAVIVTAARSSLADHYRVPTGSMEPTIHPGDRVLVDKRAFGYRLPLTSVSLGGGRDPARGDVVILDVDGTPETLLKRVVGLPDELVEVRSGHVRIDGRDVDGDHELDLGDGGGPDFGPERVPLGQYLVLGDHRGNSRDGRYFGFVPRAALHGKVVGVLERDGAFGWHTVR
jgi:signal peptidase I